MALDKEILRKVRKHKENIIPYHSSSQHIIGKTRTCSELKFDNVPILNEDERTCDILSKYQFNKSKRQPYNLKHLLAKAKFT